LYNKVAVQLDTTVIQISKLLRIINHYTRTRKSVTLIADISK